jgi:hypothetical protein
MKTSLTNRLVSLAAMATFAALGATASHAAPPAATPVFKDLAVATWSDLPAVSKAQSGVVGTLSPAALSAPALQMTLPGGQQATANLQRVARDDAHGTQSWVGTFEDSPGSLLVLSKAKGVVTGFGNYNGHTFEIQPSKSGKHTMYTVDTSKLPLHDIVERSVSGADTLTTSTTSGYGTGVSTLDASAAVVQDVLILYTSNAANAWGQATLESNIQSAVQAGIQAYQNSYVNVTLNVVGLQLSPVSEAGSMSTTLSNLKSNSTVRSLRDKLAADMVVLVSQDSGACGQASLWVSTTNGVTNTDAYAVVYSNCLSNQSLAHEIGHLQWLDHNRENATGTHAYAYSYGFRQCVTGGFGDVMSYPCSGVSVPRVAQFSNPSVYYNGLVTGIAYETDPTKAADAARSLNGTATQVANYRVGTTSTTTTVPAAPSSLVARSLAYSAVSIGWADNASNETGFKVERSRDGVTFAEIATLGAGSTSYSDGAVAAKTSYYYRVRAYNSAGGSSYSNTLSVTTPDVPPAAPGTPSSIAAGNNGDGTASVNWGSASGTVTNYEVRRAKWDSRKSTWGTLSLIATVPASVQSIVDKSGTGTYQYNVRATNSGGASANAGPAQVTVTTTTSTSSRKKK